MSLITTDQFTIVIGCGITGLSCARYLARKGVRFALMDTREQLPHVDAVKGEFPNIDLYLGPLDAAVLKRASEIVISPGVAKDQAAIKEAIDSGTRLVGDIDLFCREISAPVIAITGSNAKSTVTTLVGEMARTAGLTVGVGGNLGTPVLEMLNEGEKQLYVLELSSFQLETTHELNARVATVLNVSEDHMDRYQDMQAYYQAKHRVYRGCQYALENRDDPLTHPLLSTQSELWGFRLGKPDFKVFGLMEHEGEEWLALGLEPLMKVADIRMPGRHNVANALASLGLGHLAGLPTDAMIKTLKVFPGLEHRCQWVAEKQGVAYFNDSKGTVAALVGLGPTLAKGKIVLIAGGDGKGAAFDDLSKPVAEFVKHVVLIGKDGPNIESTLKSQAPEVSCEFASTLEDAVTRCADMAKEGDLVLLSPACASLDMFKNYAERGHRFVAAVEAL
jgi:UDP-N-acetylmuramoylalanine--D-glutamate ligase